MAWKKLPKEMRNRVTEYYEYRYRGKIFEEENILQEMSEQLKFVI